MTKFSNQNIQKGLASINKMILRIISPIPDKYLKFIIDNLDVTYISFYQLQLMLKDVIYHKNNNLHEIILKSELIKKIKGSIQLYDFLNIMKELLCLYISTLNDTNMSNYLPLYRDLGVDLRNLSVIDAAFSNNVTTIVSWMIDEKIITNETYKDLDEDHLIQFIFLSPKMISILWRTKCYPFNDNLDKYMEYYQDCPYLMTLPLKLQ